jgi:hypothetical protein
MASVASWPSDAVNCWWATAFSDGLQLADLAPLDRLTVHTLNSCYEIIVVYPATGTVLIRGGRFLPDYTFGEIGTPSDGDSDRRHGIHIGCPLAIVHDGQGVVTSRVRAIECVPGTGPH